MLAILLRSIFTAMAEEPAPNLAIPSPVEERVSEEAEALTSARPPVVTVQSAPVVSSGLVSFTMEADPRAAVRVDGCLVVEMERWEDGRWERVPSKGCPGGELAVAVAPRLVVTLPAPPPGRWRGAISWGAGCHSDLPLAFSSCTESGTLRTDPFDVRPGR